MDALAAYGSDSDSSSEAPPPAKKAATTATVSSSSTTQPAIVVPPPTGSHQMHLWDKDYVTEFFSAPATTVLSPATTLSSPDPSFRTTLASQSSTVRPDLEDWEYGIVELEAQAREAAIQRNTGG